MLDDRNYLFGFGGIFLMLLIAWAGFWHLSEAKKTTEQIHTIQLNSAFTVEGNKDLTADLNKLKSSEATTPEAKKELDSAINKKAAEISAANLEANQKTADNTSHSDKETKAKELADLEREYANKREELESK